MAPLSSAKDFLRCCCIATVRAALRLSSVGYTPGLGRTLVIAPHADDETLGCGGLIAAKTGLHRQVDVVFLTDSAGSHPGHPAISPHELALRRRSEALAALAVLGVAETQAHFLDLPDGSLDRLTPDGTSQVIARLVAFVRDLQPAEVFAPYREGGSSEHAAAFDLAAAAVSRAGGATILEYPIWAWWNPFRLKPRLRKRAGNFRFELGPLLETKRRALSCHRTQVEPVPPWRAPALPRVLKRACCGPNEYYFQRELDSAVASL